MDIEESEWSVFKEVSTSILKQFKYIINTIQKLNYNPFNIKSEFIFEIRI